MSSTIDAPAGKRPPAPRAVLSARNGVAVVFALNGLAVASWFSRVPAAREALDLSPRPRGRGGRCVSAGALLAQPTAGRVPPPNGRPTP